MCAKPRIFVKACQLHFLPVETRVPLKFGPETTTRVVCARARVVVESVSGSRGDGWGETPLSVAWVWPSELPHAERSGALEEFCRILCRTFPKETEAGHPLEIGDLFMRGQLPRILSEFNAGRAEPMPWLAALACFSPFDIAVHDAYASLLEMHVYDIYNANFMSRDLAWHYGGENAAPFAGRYPEDFLVRPAATSLPAWHLVGGRDAVDETELTGDEPNDGHPVLLADWIRRDGLTCLKIKLTGVDEDRDYARLVAVGRVAADNGAEWLSADFNCMVRDPQYVADILDRLLAENPMLYGMLLYVEQPFPRDLRNNPLDVRSIAARKPLLLDESAHDWEHVSLGRDLGWNGVALKTCKTQTGAILSLCWAKAHGMTLMVQDLTNPMLAQIPHLLLAAHAGTIMGVETNAMQFYPEASRPEARVHPGMYERRGGRVRLDSVGPGGFGYRLEEIGRELPPPEE